jgi:hypothetical protein
MEKLNEKKIGYLKYENDELEKIIKDRINNHENLFFDNEKQQLIFNQTNKIRELKIKNKKLEEAYTIINNIYPYKFKVPLDCDY